MGERNRHFSRECKRDAVQMATEKGMPVGKVARELDIHPNLLHKWRREFLKEGDKAFVGKGRITPEEAEIKRIKKDLEKVKEERDILKKALALFQTKQMKYAFMQEHGDRFRLESMCEVLSVSRSGYYAWRRRMPSERYKANAELLEHIREAHATSRRLYGSPRITAELNEQGPRGSGL